MTMLTVETITDERKLDLLAPEWEQLDASLSPRTPFTSPLWTRAWWRNYRRDGFVRDDLRVYVLRDASRRLVAVAPMMLTHRPARGPFRARELQFIGADTYVTELRGPICRLEAMPEVVKTLSAHLVGAAHEWDWVQWRGLRKSEEQDDWPRRAVPLEQYVETPNYYLPLPESWDAFKAGLPRNIKESLRKCYNSMARDGHAFEIRVVEDPAEAGRALERFLELHRGRAEADAAVQHLDVFAQDNGRRFLFDYGQAMAEAGNLRIFQMLVAGQVVATRIGFVLGDEIYLYYSGYEPEWGRYSVMTTVVAEAIQWAIGKGFRILNLSTGTDVSKTRWRPERVLYAGGFQRSTAFSSRLAFSLVDASRRRRG
jgi:CelD/BcsL family acetyltransferase involved in cellulose biosynthesis